MILLSETMLQCILYPSHAKFANILFKLDLSGKYKCIPFRCPDSNCIGRLAITFNKIKLYSWY